MKKLLLLIALMVPFSSYAKELIQNFEWLEPNNTIEIVIGEPYQLHFSCSNNNLVFTSDYADSWVHIDFTGGQHVVDSPIGYSIDENGFITGMIAGSYAIHPTGWVQAKSGVDKWLYITVVSERAEIEPNNTLDTANDITSKIRFGLYNISDIDFLKFTNNNLKWGDEVTFKIHYYGSRENPFGYKWSTFCGTDMASGGSLTSQDQVCRALVTYSNTICLEVYYDQSRSEYFLYGEEFVAEVYINGIPASEYGNDISEAFDGEGTESSPYLIKNASDLKQLANSVNSGNSYANTYFELSDNIDMTGETFEPIGNQNNHFSGKLDGKGFVIKGVSVNANSYIGLFGYIENAFINDVGIEDINFTGSSHIGGIAGYSYKSVITNCFTRGFTNGNDCVGALVGFSAEETVIQNCFSSMQHSKYQIYGSVGGLVGYNCGKLENCYFYGTINAKIFEKSTTGGIVGYNHTTGSIYYCYFIKYSDVMNGEFNFCGSLNWGECSSLDTFDLYGVTTSGDYLNAKLNTWVTNHANEGVYRKWTNDSFPSFSEYAVPIEQNSHEYVDLGLPSGLLWAKTNYGATSEDGYGAYVYWPNRNVAISEWGEEWSVPTSNDLRELYNNCTYTWKYSANSIYGVEFTGPNGNTIFLPAAGFQIDGYNQMVGQSIYYWDDNEYESSFAGSISGSNSDGISINNTYNYTFVTMPIRPVTKKSNVEGSDHNYIDLGLPSGLLWATTNVGANKPEEYGSYFAWAETTPKSEYTWSTYKYANGSETSLTKYCSSYAYGIVDYKENLEEDDDAARVNWGKPWRTPTLHETQELYNYCTWSYTSMNGVSGYIVTGPNGNTIFLPAGGVKQYNMSFYSGTDACVQTSTLFNASNGKPSSASVLYCENGSPHYWYGWSRCWGYNVRPVTDPAPNGITNINNKTTENHYYSIDGKHLATPQRGLNIVRMKDGTTRKVMVK